MKSPLRILSLLILATFVLGGCGGEPAVQTATDKAISNIPDWYLSPPANDDIFAYATATATSRDMQLALDKATTSAMATLAQNRETQVAAMQKRFTEEVGTETDAQLLDQFTQAIENVTSQDLTGTNRVNSTVVNDNGMFRAYVLYSQDSRAAAKQMLDEMKKQEELYTRFRATQAFDELNKKVDDLGK